jgi:hypothetical protein
MAVTEVDEAAREGSLSGELKGNASNERNDAANACNSFWDVEATPAGATGAEGAFGLAQHAPVEQWLESQRGPQQLILARRVFALVPADAIKTPCQARTNPSRTTTAIFTGRNVMACNWSFWIANPYVVCQIPRREGNTSFCCLRGDSKRDLPAWLDDAPEDQNISFSS